MQGEFFYGYDGTGNNHHTDAANKPHPSASGEPEGGKITEEEHLNITNSNSRLDKYLFYFSSRL